MVHLVIGDGMLRSVFVLSRDTPPRNEKRRVYRARIVVLKRRNRRGAKAGRKSDAGSSDTLKRRFTLVTEMPKQVKETKSADWVERCVWTESMIAALVNGVKGGKWYSLIDKVWNIENLNSAWLQVETNGGGAGVDRMKVAMFEVDHESRLRKLSDAIREDTYKPNSVRRAWIDKLGSKEKRPLGIPTVTDRIVQTALRNTIEPIFEQTFYGHSYGFRPQRSCKDALRQVVKLIENGYTWAVDADIKGYFDNIPHDRLMQEIEKYIADSRILKLMESYLNQDIMDGLDRWIPEAGTPQGAVISPLLANIYLNPMDHMMANKGFKLIRYADDFIILCQSREEAETALQEVRNWTESAGLTLHPTKTKIVDERVEWFDFLGYRFGKGYRSPRKKSLDKLKDKVRRLTKRSNGYSMDHIVKSLTPTLRGWYEYFKHSHYTTFRDIDGWIRRRLRAILVVREDKVHRWRYTKEDHMRWPKSYFQAIGFFSLERAHSAECYPRK